MPQGTTLLSSDHALEHRNVGSAIIAIEQTLGTTAGTNVLKNFAAGDFPARINSSGVAQQVLSGTVNLAAGTITGQIVNSGTVGGGVYGTALHTGGTLTGQMVASGTIGGGVYGTAQHTGGTISGAALQGQLTSTGTIGGGMFGTATYQGGTANGMSLGTPVVTGGMTLSANGSITQTSTADHITLTPGASKLVRGAVVRQDGIGTNSYKTNQGEQMGWSYIKINSGIARGTTTITYPVTFQDVALPLVSQLGLSAGTPAAVTDFTTSLAANGQSMAFGANSIGSTGFTVTIFTSTNVGADTFFGFGWRAKGSVT